MDSSDVAVSMVNANDANNRNFWPSANTSEHEAMEQFQGWTYMQQKRFEDGLIYIGHEFGINGRLMFQTFGASQQDIRDTLKFRRYAVPANPEAVKPKQ